MSGTLLILAGVGGLCFAAFGFAVAIFGRVGQSGLHTMVTFPTLLSIGALTAGFTLLRTPRRVVVGPKGLTIEFNRGTRLLSWDGVGCATLEMGGMNQRRRLNVTDPSGKSIAKLDGSFERFDDLVATINRFVEAKGDDTAARILRKKAQRQAALAFVVGLLMAVGSVFLAWNTREEQRAARLLDEDGKPGEAEIVRLFVAPNRVTKRLEYRVVADGQSATRNTEVEPAYWQRLQRSKTVPVIFVPGEPGISHLAEGEVEENDVLKRPAAVYGLAALGGMFGLLMLGAGPFIWNGWDLSHDSKTHKWSVKRYGKVVWGA